MRRFRYVLLAVLILATIATPAVALAADPVPVTTATLWGSQNTSDGPYTGSVWVDMSTSLDYTPPGFSADLIIEYTLDGGSPIALTPFWGHAGFVVGGDGTHTIDYHSSYWLDPSTQVVEPTKSITFEIDSSAAAVATTATVHGARAPDGSYGPGAWVSLETTPTYVSAQTYFSYDGVAYETYAPGVSWISFSTPGPNTLWFYSTNMTTNISESPKQITVTINDGAPASVTTTATVHGTRAWDGTYAPGAWVTLDTTPTASASVQFYYSLDGASFEPYSPIGTSIVFSEEGPHTLWYYSTDTSTGVTEPTRQITVVIRAQVLPVTVAHVEGQQAADGTYSSPVRITFDANAPGLLTYYSYDGFGYQPYDPGTSSIEFTTEGTYTVWFYTLDWGSGAWELPRQITVTLANLPPMPPTPPMTYALVFGDWVGDNTYSGPLTVQFWAFSNDPGDVTTKYSLDNQLTWTDCPSGSAFTIVGEGAHTLWFYSVNNATGATEQAQSVTLTIVGPPPSPPVTSLDISGEVGDNGWYRSPVTVTLTGQTAEGGPVDYSEYSLDGVTWERYTAPFAVAQEGLTVLAYRSVSLTGVVEFEQYCVIQVDTGGPTLGPVSPTDGQKIVVGDVVPADWGADDTVSGLASEWASVPKWMPLDTATVGSKTFAIGARDYAGNESSTSLTYQVIYGWAGFGPTVNADGSSIFHIGTAVPVRFKLTDAAGQPVGTAVAKISVTKVSNKITGTKRMPVYKGRPSTGDTFKYDATTQTYAFNWDTRHKRSGTYEATVTLDDGTSHSITFSLR
jgi:hypothetical protein